MDHYPLPGLLFFDIHDSSVDSPPCRDDNIAVPHSHLRCRILVRNCSDHSLGIPPSILDLNVGRGLLVEQHSVNR